jgi:hypothetical protein
MTWRDKLEIGLKENTPCSRAGAAGGESWEGSEDISQERPPGPGRSAQRLKESPELFRLVPG